MSPEALSVGAAPAHDTAGQPVAAAQQPPSDAHDKPEPASHSSPSFLHSPPDSNNAPKSEATDSELSDLDEEPVLPGAPMMSEMEDGSQVPHDPSDSGPQPEPKPEPEEDIGEVLPDHWSGAVAVFKPTMHQFKDFNRFVLDPTNPLLREQLAA